jgi:ribonucleotide monophosphatase NagD (HAD superfamily)
LPIYAAAFARADELAGRSVPRDRVLAIGDGIGTDIAGAGQAGIRSVYVASPVALRHGVLLAEASEELFASAPVKPVAMMRALVW